jgi:hypothetical protein
MAAAATSSSGARAAGGTPLITRRIPSSGEEIPALGLGTSGPFEVDSSAARRAPRKEVRAALFAAGAKLKDT